MLGEIRHQSSNYSSTFTFLIIFVTTKHPQKSSSKDKRPPTSYPTANYLNYFITNFLISFVTTPCMSVNFSRNPISVLPQTNISQVPLAVKYYLQNPPLLYVLLDLQQHLRRCIVKKWPIRFQQKCLILII